MDPKSASSEGLLAFLRKFYPEVYAVVPRDIVSQCASQEQSSVEASPRSCPTVSESGRSSPAPSEASQMEAESAAESGPESSSEISDDDGFETVVSKKRKGKPVKASPPVKRASLAAPPPRANSAASVTAKTAPVTSSGSASTPDVAASAAPQGRKSRPPPPVILQDKKAWDSISAWMIAHGAPAPVSRQVPPRTHPAPAGHSLTADLSVVMDFVSSFDVRELSVFANKIRSSNGAPHARMQAVLEHAGLIDAITRFEAPTY
ncbi:unnamed protein product, partial [Brenthis ino]